MPLTIKQLQKLKDCYVESPGAAKSPLGKYVKTLIMQHEKRAARLQKKSFQWVWDGMSIYDLQGKFIEIFGKLYEPNGHLWANQKRMQEAINEASIRDWEHLERVLRHTNRWKAKPFGLSALCYYLPDWALRHHKDRVEQGDDGAGLHGEFLDV